MRLPAVHPSRSAASGFTMTELALSIAVVGIALVAIIGILPSGLTVQQQNREDTVVTEDARYLLEAIRSGSRGMTDLAGHLEALRWTRRQVGRVGSIDFHGIHNPEPPAGGILLTNNEHIVALLSMPREETLPNGRIVTNEVTAVFRSFTGSFRDKPFLDADAGNRPSAARLDTAFRYLVTAESRPAATRPPVVLDLATNQVERSILLNQQILLDRSLNELALTFQWPVFQLGGEYRGGNNRRVFRTQHFSSGTIAVTNFLGMGMNIRRFVPGMAPSSSL